MPEPEQVEEEIVGPAVEETAVAEETVEKATKKVKAVPPPPKVYKKVKITSKNILRALAEDKEPATINIIRKRLGQPVNPELTPKIIWAADIVRAQVTTLVEAGTIKNVSETRQGKYVLA